VMNHEVHQRDLRALRGIVMERLMK